MDVDPLITQLVSNLDVYREASQDRDKLDERLQGPLRANTIRLAKLPLDVQESIAAGEDLVEWVLLGANPWLDEKVSGRLVGRHEQVEAALSVYTPHASIQKRLSAKKRNWKMLARNLSLSSEVQKLVVADMTTWESLASRENLDPDVEAILVQDEKLHVPLVYNTSLQASSQMMIARGEDSQAHVKLAKHATLTSEAASVLSRSDRYGVLLSLVENTHLSEGDLPAGFVAGHEPQRAQEILTRLGADLEAARALLGTWNGTFGELAEAIKLTRSCSLVDA